MCLQFAASAIQSDKTIVLLAVGNKASALCHVPPWLAGDRQVVLAALAQDGRVLQMLCNTDRDDEQVVCAAVTADWRALEYASFRLRCDRGVVLCGVKMNGLALQFVPPAPHALDIPTTSDSGIHIIGDASVFNGDASVSIGDASVLGGDACVLMGDGCVLGARHAHTVDMKREAHLPRTLLPAPPLLTAAPLTPLTLSANKHTRGVEGEGGGTENEGVAEDHGVEVEQVVTDDQVDAPFVDTPTIAHSTHLEDMNISWLREDVAIVLEACLSNGLALQYASHHLRGNYAVVLAAVEQNGLQCVAVCCSVLQCVAVCCSVLS